jgi:hypothetical protein
VVGGGGGGGGVGNLEAGAATPSSLCPFPSSAACQAEDQRRLFPSHDFFFRTIVSLILKSFYFSNYL